MRVLLLLPLLLLGCDKLDQGEACEATGDGFTRRDPCDWTCVEWEVPCADGSSVTPGVCSGPECTTHADCMDGFACAQTGSVTASCLPADLCPTGFADVRTADPAEEPERK